MLETLATKNRVRHLLDEYLAAAGPTAQQQAELALLRVLKKSPAAVRLELADTLATLGTCPPLVARKLAYDSDPRIAGVILAECNAICDRTLAEMALCKGPTHLEAIARRKHFPSTLSASW